MPSLAVETEDDAAAIERMLDDGAPVNGSRKARVRTSRWSPLNLLDEPPAADRALQRRAARRVFRLYCLACGRSSEVLIAPVQPGRCGHCGGTMLAELAAY
jgi:hypothetical protein